MMGDDWEALWIPGFTYGWYHKECARLMRIAARLLK
jgi:hypothetical protein